MGLLITLLVITGLATAVLSAQQSLPPETLNPTYQSHQSPDIHTDSLEQRPLEQLTIQIASLNTFRLIIHNCQCMIITLGLDL